MTNSVPELVGFVPNALPSPVPSHTSSQHVNLPQPRSQPLRAGSTKEETTRYYVDSRLMYVSRRYTKKFQPSESGDEVIGYRQIREVCLDLEEVVDVLWLSGTRLQIPYLLNITLALSTYLSAFPPDPNPTFSLLRKLDYAFSILLEGQATDIDAPLSKIQGGRGGMSRTEMVRCKSLVEGMRVLIVELMSRDVDVSGSESTAMETINQINTDTETESTTENSETEWNEYEGGHNMDIARVFEKTIIQLGESLKGGTGYDVGG